MPYHYLSFVNQDQDSDEEEIIEKSIDKPIDKSNPYEMVIGYKE